MQGLSPPFRAVAITLAVLDMAGTTVADDGLVEASFDGAFHAVDREPSAADLAYLRETMGQSKISVFRSLLGEESLAQQANRAFEEAYAARLDEVTPIPGAADLIADLRDRGVRVALTTGFARATQDALLDALGWRGLADLTLCPADAGRGRPYPDLVLTALLQLGADAVADVAVAGDTASDMRTGVAAGASVVAGVLTGAHDEARLRAGGATHVLASVADLLPLL
jgi:phosphonatase-like hydrolase